jgi:uncharacterized protein CbrC (UPF0167 family)
MSNDQPLFRFHPGAYERDVFVKSDEPCGVCGKPAVWLHTGLIYTTGDPPPVCARCISDGRLGDALKRDFSLHDSGFEDDVDEALDQEVMQRTPGFASFNAFTWPVLDGMPLAFFGHADEAMVWADPAAAEAVRKLYLDAYDEVLEGPTPYAIVFRQVDGPRYVAILDLD